MLSGVEEDSLGAGVLVSLAGEEGQSGVSVVEASEDKASLSPFEPFSPASIGSGGDTRLKVYLVKRMKRQKNAGLR